MNRRRTIFVAAFGVCLASACSSAVHMAMSPASEQQGKGMQVVSMMRPPFGDFELADMHIKFESTTLVDVQNAVGRGLIQQTGDAGDSIKWICLALKANHQAAIDIYWIVSDGEIGGSQSVVTEVRATRLEASKDVPVGCSLLGDSPRAQFLSGLKIGLSVANLRIILPESPSEFVSPTAFEHVGGRQITRRDKRIEFDVSRRLEVTVHDGAIVNFRAVQLTTH